ncbi:MAG: gamma-glutamylcyclotransferase [Coleofasciculaceae cyanobacterium SM2_3_26]|nr:gamma-glutamylcyclotransferase [Coleofasciculaceae cyanobacterium SM2_3_26]
MSEFTASASTEPKYFFICGSALRGQPDHQNLQSAKFVKEAKTLPKYRLHAVGNGWHPGIYPVEEGGIAIPGEIYEMTQEQYRHLLDNEPPDLYEGQVVLEDGQTLSAMLYPQELVEKHGWQDISHYGGWANYKQAEG